ncbi:bifunctional glycosyltransferase family 2/GtrA family protein [Actinomadura luteofluorescens]|uniref:bifunctional glycosyltransferase family 2/GtrA family protein n=1 Tax=Actinomadura luteofluorescens TaxID=46163 RepID=UPI0021644D73|nr:bifunctional glycosyltransferase family 2/GtrA family protein [Actinomadura glauciflava]MCR3739105.1 Glycosyltransferase, catalytic subunit of cellulose synthase and poly-beta-1,6-N-acetylglucosamine synthase [Actinomadura glauciflava]
MSHLITEPGTPAAPPPPPHEHGGRGRLVEVVVPVHNEERVLAASVERLHAYLTDTLPYPFRITVADNASTDATWPIARDLAARHPRVRAVRLRDKGRGRALRHVWGTSDADVVAYMDVDLSTDLDAFLPLVAPLISGHSDLAIGSRLTRGSAVVRGPRREIISRCYNLLLRTALAARFTDAQCGFKAARTEIVQALLPSVEDEEWFFDTELLLLAERNGLRIHEVPVDWVDDPDSRVDVLRTARDDLRGMARVARRMLTGAFRAPVGGRPGPAAGRATDALPAGMARQLPAFAVIGVLSTLAQLILFVLLRLFLGPLWANALSLVITTVGNTAANRRFTFGVTGHRRALRQQLEGGAAFLLGLALSTGGLALLHATAPGAGRAVEVAALVTANAVATLARFLLMRAWIFHPRRLDHHPATPATGPTAGTVAAPAPAHDSTGGTTA